MGTGRMHALGLAGHQRKYTAMYTVTDLRGFICFCYF